MIAPVLPSWFDADFTRRFLKDIEDLKRVRKGKVGLHLDRQPGAAAAGRPSGCGRSSRELGQEPLAWITERAAYADLAEQGLAVFDKPQRAYAPIRAQWAPVLGGVA